MRTWWRASLPRAPARASCSARRCWWCSFGCGFCCRGARDFTEPLYSGGPVMREVLVALFRAATPPAEAAFQVLPGVYLTLHPATIEALIAEPHERLRLYAGFSGWAPRQLEAEIDT